MMIEKQERVKFLGAVIKKLQKKNQKYYKLDSEVIVKSKFPTSTTVDSLNLSCVENFPLLFFHHSFKVNHYILMNKYECI